MCVYRSQRFVWIVFGVLCLSSFSRQGDAWAQTDVAKSLQSQESDETTRLIKAELPQWRMWKGASHEVELKLEPKSVLRWTNPGVGRTYGDLYFWTADGRPEVIMSVFKAWDPANGFHVEMQSLSLRTVEAERGGKTAWSPSQPGIKLHDIPEAPLPADSAVRRLAQMRTLLTQFEAVLTDKRRNNSGERQELRLLPQPLFRYQNSNAELIDGAVFGFVLGTDPETCLLIEARRTVDSTKWQYGLARMNNDSMSVSYSGHEVWRVERQNSDDWLREPYRLMSVPEAP